MVTAFRTKKNLENWAFKVEKFVIIECQIYRLSVAFLVVNKKINPTTTWEFVSAWLHYFGNARESNKIMLVPKYFKS